MKCGREAKSPCEMSGKQRGRQAGHDRHRVSLVAIPDTIETHRQSQRVARKRMRM